MLLLRLVLQLLCWSCGTAAAAGSAAAAGTAPASRVSFAPAALTDASVATGAVMPMSWLSIRRAIHNSPVLAVWCFLALLGWALANCRASAAAAAAAATAAAAAAAAAATAAAAAAAAVAASASDADAKPSNHTEFASAAATAASSHAVYLRQKRPGSPYLSQP